MSTLLTDTLKTRVAGAAVTTTNGLNVGGACTATSFIGDGSGLTGIAATANVSTSDLFVVGVSTLSDTVSLPDNKSITLGGDDDLEIHHAGGGNSYIKNNTGELQIRSDTTKIFNKSTSQTIAGFTQGASVGITTVGILTAYSNVAVGLGATIHGSSGNAVFAGIVTAATISATTGTYTGTVTANSFSGNGAALTGLPAGFTELDGALFN